MNWLYVHHNIQMLATTYILVYIFQLLIKTFIDGLRANNMKNMVSLLLHLLYMLKFDDVNSNEWLISCLRMYF